MTYSNYRTSNYKIVSFTPKDEIAQAIFDYCVNPKYSWMLDLNPQDLVRMALFYANIIPKQQDGTCDSSSWEIGLPIKTSLWQENAIALTQFAKEQGCNKQDVIRESVMDYIYAKQSSVA